MQVSKGVVDSRAFLRALVTFLSLAATMGLVLTALSGFEEPNDVLLLLSSGLLLVAVVAVFAHLGATRLVEPALKRVWFQQLVGRRALSAWAEYLTCEDLRATADAWRQADMANRGPLA